MFACMALVLEAATAMLGADDGRANKIIVDSGALMCPTGDCTYVDKLEGRQRHKHTNRHMLHSCAKYATYIYEQQ